MATLMPMPMQAFQAFISGVYGPINGGQLFTYDAGTVTPKATYTTAAGDVANANPVILNARGEPPAGIFLGSGAYKIVLKDAAGATIWTQDNVSIADYLLGSNLANTTDPAKGSALVPTTGRVVNTVSDLRALPKTGGSPTAFMLGYYAKGDGGGGSYYLDPTDTTSADNGGTIIVATDGGRWKLSYFGIVSVRQFGAKGDGATNDYPAFSAALTAVGRIHVPAGEYRTDTTIQMGDNKVIYLANGATIVRKTAATSTDPTIWFDGSYSSVVGEGGNSFIRTEKTSPNGVVRFGAATMATTPTASTNYNTLDKLYVSGGTAQGSGSDYGVLLNGPEFLSRTCYFNRITDVEIGNANYGITCRGWANANHISNVHFYRIGSLSTHHALGLLGCLENTVVGCFHHSSPGGASIIVDQFDNTANGGVQHTAQFNRVLAFCCEQGGSSYSLRHIAGTYGIYDFSSNTSLGPQFTSYGNNNTFSWNGVVQGHQVLGYTSLLGPGSFTVQSDGRTQIGTTTSDTAKLFVYQASTTLADGGIVVRHQGAGASAATMVRFLNNAGAEAGSITSTSTATTYATSSDYRLKESVKPMTGALAKIDLLKPCFYSWKIDGSDGEGFIAHELQQVFPQAVTGKKDGTRIERKELEPARPAFYDKESGELTPAVEAVYEEKVVPDYQGIDTSFLVPTLVAAIQEQQVLIKDLAEKVAALEAK